MPLSSEPTLLCEYVIYGVSGTKDQLSILTDLSLPISSPSTSTPSTQQHIFPHGEGITRCLCCKTTPTTSTNASNLTNFEKQHWRLIEEVLNDAEFHQLLLVGKKNFLFF
ncbi:unnamed protein product [Meloidogyne enterolobii]|uniref:Uncharacterized protein n=1 Tax=Meloidogyne enterolobii TaxID=390850 RepID=A0ACB0Z011_MELEN